MDRIHPGTEPTTRKNGKHTSTCVAGRVHLSQVATGYSDTDRTCILTCISLHTLIYPTYGDTMMEGQQGYNKTA